MAGTSYVYHNPNKPTPKVCRVPYLPGILFFQLCCGTGSGIRCLFDPGIWNCFFLDPWSRWKLSDNFRGKISIILWKLAQMFFFSIFKNKIIFNFVNFMATKKGVTTNFFPPLSFVAVFRSGNRDPGSQIRNTGYQRPNGEKTFCF